MSQNKTLLEVLTEGKKRLQAANKEDYALEAQWLLMAATGLSQLAMHTERERILPDAQIAQFESYLAERECNRPVQYILGACDFMGLTFSVGEGVLIPRADTETLVETILEIQKTDHLSSVLDIGTGSGCIPISLAHHGKFQATGLDISPKALAFAKQNAEDLQVSVRFLESDLFSALPKGETFDCIVSNPPYIETEVVEGLMAEVRDFEPRNALDGGVDGLDFYRAIVAQSPLWLRDGGWLFFEIGYNQGEALLSLLNEGGFTCCELRQDLAGLDRVVFGKLGK